MKYFIFLLLLPLSSWAECLIPFEQRGEFYTNHVRQHEETRSDYNDLFLQSLIVNNEIRMHSDRGILSANAEGFLRPGAKEFVIVPVVGLSLYMDKNDVAYYCLNIDPEGRDPFLEISFVNRSGFNRVSRLFKKKKNRRSKYVNTNIGIEMAPLSDMTDRIEAGLDSVPVIGPVYKGINQGIFDQVFLIMRKAINFIFKAGVYKIRMDKRGLTIWTQARIFRIISCDFKISQYDLEDNFLKDFAASEESEEYDVYYKEIPEEEQSQVLLETNL